MNYKRTDLKQMLMFILTAGFLACEPNKSSTSDMPIKIEWVDNLIGDFSFIGKWTYPEGIYKNEFGQLSCDGLCPPEINVMIDSTGHIYKDSLKAFYKIVDTTHQTYSIQCEAWCYEWAGTNSIVAIQKNKDTIECNTACNTATHCCLHFYIINDICYPEVELKSIVANKSMNYPCKNGYIKIDKEILKKGIIKADFDMNFENKENPKQPIFWKGKIYTKIKSL
jgi:hypothetical protein